ncbi:hypothetical protein Dpep_0369 [Dethiosulfovibrio peptidovorans DSM 11002]|uniref:Uncharacterized protein n=1 Tax=Dethiosulfovibrio peptidovorans DSM 11002 TaxID=469381 RepID=D2Z3U5_9BACT|nr:hypothetical protein [Dethiosulfovibrio peptidovorans]EFC90401.1 hypothetical protein Dpep_0369 [Dethiosulfovibrio peptidovorans DSM 11002]
MKRLRPVSRSYRNGSVVRVRNKWVAMSDADTAKAVVEVARGMPEDATIYDLYDETRDRGIHADEPVEWGLDDMDVRWWRERRMSHVLRR